MATCVDCLIKLWRMFYLNKWWQTFYFPECYLLIINSDSAESLTRTQIQHRITSQVSIVMTWITMKLYLKAAVEWCRLFGASIATDSHTQEEATHKKSIWVNVFGAVDKTIRLYLTPFKISRPSWLFKSPGKLFKALWDVTQDQVAEMTMIQSD